MIHEYFDGFEYEQRDQRGWVVLVRGLQVGRYAVRKCAVGELHHGGDVSSLWSIDHWQARCVISTASSVEDAIRIADEVSRSAPDLDADSLEVLLQQFAGPLLAWVDQIGTGPFVGFREWCAARAPQAA